MKRSLLHLLFTTLILLGCGKAATGPTDDPAKPPTPPDGGGTKVTLRLFGAPWCTNCKAAFPQINAALKADLTKQNAAVKGEVYVTTGETPAQRPTPEIAAAYRDFLKMDFTPFADEWKWKKFQEQVQQNRELPAAVVMDKDGKVIKVFRPGPTTFVVEDVVAFVKSQLN